MKKQGRNKGAARISKDWKVFAGNLAGVLSEMAEGRYLDIRVKQSNRFLLFVTQGSSGIRAEISSNIHLSGSDRLTERQINRLVKAGWKTPTGSHFEATPDGTSANFHIDFPAPVKPSRMARLAVQALSEILRVSHPGALEYKAWEFRGGIFRLPALNIEDVSEEENQSSEKAAASLRLIVRDATGISDLEYDDDQDIALHYQNITFFVGIVGNPPRIRFCSPLFRDVRKTQKLYATLNELNSSLGFMHFFIRDKIIFAISEIPAASMDYETVTKVMETFSVVANKVYQMLENQLGSKKTRPLANQESEMIH